jgi:hypothetical protein
VCAAAAGYHVGVRSAYSTACCHPRRARCSPPRSHSQPPHSQQVRATRQVSTPPWRGAGRLAWRGGPCARRVVRADPLSEVQRGLQPGLAQVCQEEPAQPSEIARAVAFLLDLDSAYHGSVLFVDGGTDAVLRPKRSDTPIGHASYGRPVSTTGPATSHPPACRPRRRIAQKRRSAPTRARRALASRPHRIGRLRARLLPDG